MKKMKNKRKKAFTLVELLVVIAIVGLLSTIVLAVTSGVSEQGRIAKGLQFSQHLENSLGAYLIGRWSFDEGSDNTCLDGKDACDSSGWNNNGTFSGTSVWRCAIDNKDYTPSGKGCSLDFNGVNQYISIAENNLFDFKDILEKPFTVSAWIKSESNPVSGQTIISMGTTDFNSLSFNIDSNRKLYLVADTDGISSWEILRRSLSFVPNNQWAMVVFTRDTGNYKFFIDGISAGGDFSNIDDIYINNNSVKIGGHYALTSEWQFNGLIDGVHIYGTALTASQIQFQYYAGLNKLLAKGLIDETEYQQRLAVR
jgi:prepilin-type N-terminal cleavage/methylation domain-containing protein